MGQSGDKAVVRLYRLGNWVIRVVGSLIFIGLVWYSFRYTQYMLPEGAEIPANTFDSRSRNAAAFLAAVGGMAGLMIWERRAGGKAKFLLRRISLTAGMILMFAAGMWWINSSAHVPVGDQAFIYGGASYFMEEDYGFLGAAGYCGMHPHQLGLTALCELLFSVTGAFNYRSFEVVCVLMAVGIVFLGYGILSEMTGSVAVAAGYHILMAGCLPLIFYTSWVYGEIPSIFFSLSAVWALLRYASAGKKRYLILLAGSAAMSTVVRKNSLILLIALILAAVLYAAVHKDVKLLLAVAASAALTCGIYEGIYKMYEVRSGYEHCDGIPIIAWFTMGLQETEGICGWYNNYPKDTYYEAEFDRERTAAMARADLTERFNVFKREPAYAWGFFREKVLSQWNAPLYQALYFNAESPEKEGGPVPGSVAAKVGNELFVTVLGFCDRWQFIIYAGMLFYFLFAVKADSNILQHVPAITMIGGFLFSIIYEAKARYVFPYYVMMFPYAACGYRQMLESAMCLRGIRYKAGETEAAEEGREAA